MTIDVQQGATTPAQAFAACVKVCGEGVLPDGFTRDDFDLDISEPPEVNALARGIVHLQGWLIGKGCELRFTETSSANHKDAARKIKCFTLSGIVHYENFYPFGDNYASTLFIALCKLAERIVT